MPDWLTRIAPILLLLVAVGIVMWRMPKVDLGHSDAFKRRRVQNWLPLGLTYAFLYFGRYNLSAIVGDLDKAGLLTRAQFNELDGVGAWVYGIAFLINGPLTDRLGGRATILISAGASAICNAAMAVAMGRATSGAITADELKSSLLVANAANMYFQSFGAVSIVKVNAPWFHVRERGVLGGLFGILISLGLYFAYDWSLLLAKLGFAMAFWGPAAVLACCVVMAASFVRDTPSHAGFDDFDTGDATSGQTGQMPVGEVVRKMFSQRVIWIIVAIEFCSGFIRQAVMKQYRPFAKAIGADGSFVYQNWGMLLCVAGILGGVFAGFISDQVFQSRRGPVASVLYGGLLLGCVAAFLSLEGPLLGWSVVFMSLCVIGVHGMLSGTASMDFGGSKNAGVVTGVIDGFVYLGTGTQAFLYAKTLPMGAAAKAASAWSIWPGAMIPVALIGLGLCTTIWNARPQKGGGGH
ncbi:MAG: MFS transporter [Deltaproteobacteria bacterium]|nr:MFS transporter [Deltaproteobacteria bacterium]